MPKRGGDPGYCLVALHNCDAHKHQLIGPSQTETLLVITLTEDSKVTTPEQEIVLHITQLQNCKMLFLHFVLYTKRSRQNKFISEVRFSYLLTDPSWMFYTVCSLYAKLSNWLLVINSYYLQKHISQNVILLNCVEKLSNSGSLLHLANLLLTKPTVIQRSKC